MTIYHIILLFLGLALFLYGMEVMSSSLEYAAKDRLKPLLEKLTANRFLGVLAGTGITAVIQSSSAATVMVVGLVDSGLMTLEQAVWFILGANIGTTVTGQLLAVNTGSAAPILVLAGLLLMVCGGKSRRYQAGRLLFGLGALFLGMRGMGEAMAPLGKSERALSLVSGFQNPAAGILAGALFTALIQSSSASVGILQSLASSGAIRLEQAVFVLFGQNIGTCVTALLAAAGTCDNAKRATVVHVLFNAAGTLLFTVICLLTPFTAYMESLTPGNPAAQIANIHTVFNLVTAVLFLPFGDYLVRAAKIVWKETGGMEKV